MPSKIPNLWPTETVSVEILSPLAILRMQAQNLTELTHRLVIGEVTTDDRQEDGIYHHFDIVAPALNGYRHRILTIKHDTSMLYPVSYLVAKKRDMKSSTIASWSELLSQEQSGVIGPVAMTEADFIKALKEAFNSDFVLSVINSLIARSNEARPENAHPMSKELQPA